MSVAPPAVDTVQMLAFAAADAVQGIQRPSCDNYLTLEQLRVELEPVDRLASIRVFDLTQQAAIDDLDDAAIIARIFEITAQAMRPFARLRPFARR